MPFKRVFPDARIVAFEVAKVAEQKMAVDVPISFAKGNQISDVKFPCRMLVEWKYMVGLKFSGPTANRAPFPLKKHLLKGRPLRASFDLHTLRLRAGYTVNKSSSEYLRRHVQGGRLKDSSICTEVHHDFKREFLAARQMLRF